MKLAALIALAVAGASIGAGGSTSETISMGVRPTVLRANEPATATGVVSSGRPDQLVTMQFRPCEETLWREIAETLTHEDGSWTVDILPGIGGAVRAASAGGVSQPVEIRQRPSVSLGQRPPGTFFVWVNAQRSMWRKKVVLQRYDPRRRVWVVVRTVLLTETGAPQGVAWIWSGTGKFAVKVPKGTQLRATLPLSQARPCYLAGNSNVLTR